MAKLNINKELILDLVYPIGSIYMSINSTSPATFIGGTWERIQGRFLYAGDTNITPGSEGGAINHQHKYVVWSIVSKQVTGTANATNNGEEKPSVSRKQLSTGYPWNINSKLGDGSAWNYTDGIQYSSTGTTSMESGMPPYLSVYIWKRVS